MVRPDVDGPYVEPASAVDVNVGIAATLDDRKYIIVAKAVTTGFNVAQRHATGT